MTGDDEIRGVQRATWAGLSAGWDKWDSVIMDQMGRVGAAMTAHPTRRARLLGSEFR